MKPSKNLREKAPFLRTEASHDAEIDRHQLAGVIDKQVAGMHVGMKKAVAQRMAQEGLNHRAREALEIQPTGFKQSAVGQWRRVDPFEREHIARGAVPIHRGDAEVGIVAGVLRHLRERRRLETQVHLERDRPTQRLDHLDESQSPRLRRHALGVARDKRECVEINLEASLHLRPQYLHRDGADTTVGDDFSPVHLGDRSGCDRRAERREQVGQWPTQRGCDGAFGVGLREWRHLVLQRLEVARQ